MTLSAASGATALTATLSAGIGIGTADTFLAALFSLNNVSNSTADNERDHCNNYEIYGSHKSSFNSLLCLAGLQCFCLLILNYDDNGKEYDQSRNDCPTCYGHPSVTKASTGKESSEEECKESSRKTN